MSSTTRLPLTFGFQFTINDMNLEVNLVLSLPIHLLAHAARLGHLESTDLFATLSDPNTDEIRIRETAKAEPVFVRGKQGGRDVDPSGPMTGDSVGRLMKQALRETGISAPEGGDTDSEKVFRLYGWRKDFATRGTSDPNVGPELTRKMLGHRPSSKALEATYDQAIQTISLTALVGVEGSTATPATDPAEIRR